ncbi:MAG TPA: F0F1 ATP synthase subunit epsilon, partial [Alphaproteobacteria bacterium]|nr:F0F1 ATP synthase subunit epsilon [Alphaproteobacteria bacterium]
MAEAAAGKVSFELVSPERLLFSADVDMVVVPGAEGDFGILPGHSLFLSQIRPGVIEVYNKGAVTDRIFIAGGFAEATPKRCTVLADAAVPVSELRRDEIETKLRDAREDVTDAADEAARKTAEREVAVLEAMLAAARA